MSFFEDRMKIFTKEQIENMRRDFDENNYELNTGKIKDISFNYFILPQELNPELSNFVFRMTGETIFDGEIFGVSNSIKPNFRLFAVYHEVFEFRQFPRTELNRCGIALQAEIEAVPREQKEFKIEYLKMRKRFFMDLINYGKKCGEYYTENDINQWACNVRRLDE